MTTKLKSKYLLGVLMTAGLLAEPVWAQVSAEELGSIRVPDEMQTSIGTLTFNKGAPTPETAKTVYDYFAQMRGVQDFMDNQGAVSMLSVRQLTPWGLRRQLID